MMLTVRSAPFAALLASLTLLCSCCDDDDDVANDDDVADDDDTAPDDDDSGDGDGLPDWIGVGSALEKFRPDHDVPEGRSADLSAARNEFEPFQIVVGGGTLGRALWSLTLSDLTGSDGEIIPSSAAVIYQVALHNVPSASNEEGDAGPWPDPLIPAVDPHFEETRDAFPVAVPPEEVRSVWVDLYVPPETSPGRSPGRPASAPARATSSSPWS